MPEPRKSRLVPEVDFAKDGPVVFCDIVEEYGPLLLDVREIFGARQRIVGIVDDQGPSDFLLFEQSR